MSFEMKYDRNGKVITPMPEIVPDVAQITQFEPIEQQREQQQPVYEAQERETDEPQDADDTHDHDDHEDHEEEEVQEVEAPRTEQRTARPEKRKSNSQHLRVLREKAERAERAERERDEMARRLMEMEVRSQQPQKQPEPEEDLNVDVADDDLAEGKHLTKLKKQIIRLKQDLDETKRQTKEREVEYRIKAKYSDFDEVVTRDNIEEFKRTRPELSWMLNSTSDSYTQAVSIYSLLKDLGIHGNPPPERYERERAVVHKNVAKPRTLTSISPQQGESPLSRANAFATGELTKEVKEREYAAMMEIIRRG